MGTRERRRSPRHRPSRDRVRVGWFDGESFRHASARLRNLSSGGAVLWASGVKPATNEHVWVCTDGRSADDWVPARVVGKATDKQGQTHLRLMFTRPCPGRLFRNVVWGEASSADSQAARSAADTLDQPQIVPPHRHDPGTRPKSATRSSKNKTGSKPALPSNSPAETADVLPQVEGGKPGLRPWAGEKARILAAQRAVRWPWMVMLGLNLILSVLLILLILERMANVHALHELGSALGLRH
jgi:hypothetical protein